MRLGSGFRLADWLVPVRGRALFPGHLCLRVLCTPRHFEGVAALGEELICVAIGRLVMVSTQHHCYIGRACFDLWTTESRMLAKLRAPPSCTPEASSLAMGWCMFGSTGLDILVSTCWSPFLMAQPLYI